MLQYDDGAHSTTVTEAEHRSDLKLTKGSP